ncbi:beta-arrestin-1-like [Penaeus japonicus]|uniref:beta-arrestin-1-like n=1 Tax=Penaeus japonicus TaxID=27405 RepID=UPI001C711BB9|nr:beta-arrestin-1-like [Penaeus japonicus]
MSQSICTQHAHSAAPCISASGFSVFKKSSPNGKITVYLGKRDFVDHITHVDPIDGVVLIDPEYLKDRKVFGHVLAAFRYGREDLDVLGLTFRKDLYLASEQIFPLDPNNKRPLTRLQVRLVMGMNSASRPFHILFSLVAFLLLIWDFVKK